MRFFPVRNPYRLVILFVAFIHIVCCLSIHLYQTMHIDMFFSEDVKRDKCNRDCNRDYYQCYRNRLHLWFCLFVIVIEHVISNCSR